MICTGINPASSLLTAGWVTAPKTEHFSHLQASELPAFLTSLAGYHGSCITRMATNLLLLTGVRTIERRAAEWQEFGLENALLTFPENRMKKRRKHLEPLSDQVLRYCRNSALIPVSISPCFLDAVTSKKPMSEASINMVIKRIGYDGKATGHGFWHIMSTILHEQGFNTAWIEMQLAHVDKNSIRGTNNHAQYLESRREMMQWYADYIDSSSIHRQTVSGVLRTLRCGERHSFIFCSIAFWHIYRTA